MKPPTSAVQPETPENRAEPREGPLGIFHQPGKFFARRILVVDDEPLIRWSVAQTLTEAGFDVEQAEDAAATLRMVSETELPFDTLIVDLRLPDMDDLSLVSTLRQVLPDARLVVMTAFGTPEIIADAEALGATVVGKPFELEHLRQLVS